MSARESSPWESVLPGHVAPPPWQGPAQVHRMLDEQERRDDVRQQRAIDSGRVCTRCGNAYPPTREFFFRNKAMRDGLRPECKACYREMPSIAKRTKVQPVAAEPESEPIQREELEQLAQRAVDALMQVLPPWTLITPGSAKEKLARRVWPALWWPFPGKDGSE